MIQVLIQMFFFFVSETIHHLFHFIIFSVFSTDSGVFKKPNNISTGRGHLLGSSSNSPIKNTDGISLRDNIRNVWSHKFDDEKKNIDTENSPSDSKNRRLTVTEASSKWEEIDDDISIHSVQNTVIEIDDLDDSDGETDSAKPSPRVNRSKDLTQRIKQELVDDLGCEDNNIEMIDDEFDEDLNQSVDILSDTSVIDDIFGTDTLMTDFNDINNVIMSDPENKGNSNKEIITCPICQDRLPREDLSSHLEGCSGITVKIDPKKRTGRAKPFYKNEASTSKAAKVSDPEQEILRRAGYSEETIKRLVTETAEAKAYNERILNEMADERQPNQHRAPTNQLQPLIPEILFDDDGEPVNSADLGEKQQCPVCNTLVYADLINQHLDDCLQGNV